MENSIYEKLARIQSKLSVPKNQFNKFGNYHYRSCEDILEALKTVLFSEKLVLVISDEVIGINNKNYIKSTVKLTDGKEEIISTAYAREAVEQKGMADAQITGSASSYARKYALNGLFCIDDNKDDDTKDNTQSKTVSIEQKTNDVICECGSKMVIKTSSKGSQFLGCSDYPHCRNTRSLQK